MSRLPPGIIVPAPRIPLDAGKARILWADGDSRVATTTGTPSGPTAVFPYFTWQRLGGTQWGTLKNQAQGGFRTTDVLLNYPIRTKPFLSKSSSIHNLMILLVGWNDMMNNTVPVPLLSPAQVFANIIQIVQDYQNDGNTDCYIMTQTDSSGPVIFGSPPYSYNNESWEGVGGLRDQLDTMVRGNTATYGYGLIDILGVPTLGPDGSCVTYQHIVYVDEVHPSGGEYTNVPGGYVETGEGLMTDSTVSVLSADWNY